MVKTYFIDKVNVSFFTLGTWGNNFGRMKCFRYTDKKRGFISIWKIANLQYYLLEIGILTKNSLSPEYFDCLSPLTGL